jgi:hypothetical protein
MKKKTKSNKPRIAEQNNDQFQITYNSEEDCFDLLLKQSEYDAKIVQSMMIFIYNLGKHAPETLRIGTLVSSIIENKPKLILN